jgi:hypothetical protein
MKKTLTLLAVPCYGTSGKAEKRIAPNLASAGSRPPTLRRARACTCSWSRRSGRRSVGPVCHTHHACVSRDRSDGGVASSARADLLLGALEFCGEQRAAHGDELQLRLLDLRGKAQAARSDLRKTGTVVGLSQTRREGDIVTLICCSARSNVCIYKPATKRLERGPFSKAIRRMDMKTRQFGFRCDNLGSTCG